MLKDTKKEMGYFYEVLVMLPELDHSTVAVLLSRHLGLAERSELEVLGSGDFCLAFRLGDQVIRVARHTDAASALVREACVLAAIAEKLPLAVPGPVPYSPVNCPPFSMHREIVGEVLTQDRWMAMPVEARENTAADLALFMKALHTLPVDIASVCGLKQYDSRAYVQTLRETAPPTLYPLLNYKIRLLLDTTLEQWESSTDAGTQRSLLHCDIAPGHLLYDAATCRLTGVIDFGDVAIGEPARDFIYIYEDFGAELLAEVLNHYEHSALFLSAIRKWYLLETIAWTLDMITRGHGSEVEEGIAEVEREVNSIINTS